MQIQTLNLSMPQGLIQELDRQAKKEYTSRSELIRRAIMSYLNSQDRWDMIFDYGRKKTRELNLKSADIDKAIQEYRQENEK